MIRYDKESRTVKVNTLALKVFATNLEILVHAAMLAAIVLNYFIPSN